MNSAPTSPQTSRVDAESLEDDGLGKPVPVEKGGFRDRIRSKPGLGQAWRVGVFLVGLLCVAVGLALAVLPGPLTIPPVLLGLWVWSTEFNWARRFFDSFKAKGRAAWAHAKAYPVTSSLVTVGGLAGAGMAFWAVQHYELVEQAKSMLGV